MIRDTSDCAIGWEAATAVLESLDVFADEYESHLVEHSCKPEIEMNLPCEAMCPAHVNIPAYIALVGEGDYAGAVKMIRKDNPFPTSCAFICENPCEIRCRRTGRRRARQHPRHQALRRRPDRSRQGGRARARAAHQPQNRRHRRRPLGSDLRVFLRSHGPRRHGVRIAQATRRHDALRHPRLPLPARAPRRGHPRRCSPSAASTSSSRRKSTQRRCDASSIAMTRSTSPSAPTAAKS